MRQGVPGQRTKIVQIDPRYVRCGHEVDVIQGARVVDRHVAPVEERVAKVVRRDEERASPEARNSGADGTQGVIREDVDIHGRPGDAERHHGETAHVHVFDAVRSEDRLCGPHDALKRPTARRHSATSPRRRQVRIRPPRSPRAAARALGWRYGRPRGGVPLADVSDGTPSPSNDASRQHKNGPRGDEDARSLEPRRAGSLTRPRIPCPSHTTTRFARIRQPRIEEITELLSVT